MRGRYLRAGRAQPLAHPPARSDIARHRRLRWTQCEGEEIVEIRVGDVIWCPPGHKHWHGATATTAMTHIAIQEALDGKNVEWLEPVTGDQYARGKAA